MNVNEWLEQWLAIFPPDKFVPTNGYNRGKVSKELVNKMQKFVKEHPLATKDIIFAATRMYILSKKTENFAYTKRPIFFINKQGEGSLLDTYCDKVISGEKQQETNIEYQPQNDFL